MIKNKVDICMCCTDCIDLHCKGLSELSDQET